jgi:acyl-CoA dehydrogenase
MNTDELLSPEQLGLREVVRQTAAAFSLEYWREHDANHEFPWEFYKAFADGGWLGILIPEAYGGQGAGVAEAALLLQAVAESGAGMNGATAMHLTIFGLNPIVKHGSEALKERVLSPAARGELHVSFGITEPTSGSDLPSITTKAVKDKNGDYKITGAKVWMSKAQEASKVVLLTRTTPLSEGARRSDGLSLFFADLDPRYVRVQEIKKMGRNAVDSNEVWFDELPVNRDDLIGEEGKAFSYLLDGLNPERIVIAAEAIGLGRVALATAARYAKDRVVFGRPIGENQGIQFPLADSEASLWAAELAVRYAARLYDDGKPAGGAANAAKYLAAEAAFAAADRAVQTLGGYGYACEFDVERYFREARLMKIAPITQELVLSHLARHELGLPRSY